MFENTHMQLITFLSFVGICITHVLTKKNKGKYIERWILIQKITLVKTTYLFGIYFLQQTWF